MNDEVLESTEQFSARLTLSDTQVGVQLGLEAVNITIIDDDSKFDKNQDNNYITFRFMTLNAFVPLFQLLLLDLQQQSTLSPKVLILLP